ncbi:MAG: hypothetical protein AAF125_07100, partial [Chloroflexota bacterium]
VERHAVGAIGAMSVPGRERLGDGVAADVQTSMRSVENGRQPELASANLRENPVYGRSVSAVAKTAVEVGVSQENVGQVMADTVSMGGVSAGTMSRVEADIQRANPNMNKATVSDRAAQVVSQANVAAGEIPMARVVSSGSIGSGAVSLSSVESVQAAQRMDVAGREMGIPGSVQKRVVDDFVRHGEVQPDTRAAVRAAYVSQGQSRGASVSEAVETDFYTSARQAAMAVAPGVRPGGDNVGSTSSTVAASPLQGLNVANRKFVGRQMAEAVGAASLIADQGSGSVRQRAAVAAVTNDTRLVDNPDFGRQAVSFARSAQSAGVTGATAQQVVQEAAVGSVVSPATIQRAESEIRSAHPDLPPTEIQQRTQAVVEGAKSVVRAAPVTAVYGASPAARSLNASPVPVAVSNRAVREMAQTGTVSADTYREVSRHLTAANGGSAGQSIAAQDVYYAQARDVARSARASGVVSAEGASGSAVVTEALSEGSPRRVAAAIQAQNPQMKPQQVFQAARSAEQERIRQVRAAGTAYDQQTARSGVGSELAQRVIAETSRGSVSSETRAAVQSAVRAHVIAQQGQGNTDRGAAQASSDVVNQQIQQRTERLFESAQAVGAVARIPQGSPVFVQGASDAPQPSRDPNMDQPLVDSGVASAKPVDAVAELIATRTHEGGDQSSKSRARRAAPGQRAARRFSKDEVNSRRSSSTSSRRRADRSRGNIVDEGTSSAAVNAAAGQSGEGSHMNEDQASNRVVSDGSSVSDEGNSE